MKIVIAAAGKFRSHPEKALYDQYVRRLPWQTSLVEIGEKKTKNSGRRDRLKSPALQSAIPEGAVVIALDEGGTAFSSQKFAEKIGDWQDLGVRNLAFLIGGADGLSPDILGAADETLSLGPMTWPHLLVRALLAEQLYRASTILSGHPYHRA